LTSHEAANQTAPPPVPPEPPDWLPSWLDWFWELGRFVTDDLFRTLTRNLTGQTVVEVVAFLVLLVLFFFVGRGIRWLMRRTVLTPSRMDPALARLTGHFVVFVAIILGFAIGLTIFGTNIAAFATGLGLLSLALGFGMQNTVANIMGGISLAFDQPFRIGDRIQVGEYWGTVQLIGLRSTRIETPRKETVIIPNKIMEEREIWNYTLGSPEYRLDIDVGISYDSDWRQAEKIMLDAAERHPNILHYPPGRVVMRDFGDSRVKMQLRCWIADVTARADTISDLLKTIKDRFDHEGVEIPYPYRTIVYKKDLEAPKQPPAAEYRPFLRTVQGSKVLVAVAGPQPVRERASFVASLAKALSAGVVALYIERPGASRREGEDALRIMSDLMKGQRIWFKPVVRAGNIVTTIRDVAREEDVDLILVGAGRGGVTSLWKRTPEVGSRLRRELTRPVFTVPRDLKLTPQLVAWLREQMDAAREQREDREQQTGKPDEPPSRTHEDASEVDPAPIEENHEPPPDNEGTEHSDHDPPARGPHD
jgi:small-conductance mechanosensitive channel/nucleotide-binding universal stress UspA family protein